MLSICLNSYAYSENANIEQYLIIVSMRKVHFNPANPGQDNLFLRNRYFCV